MIAARKFNEQAKRPTPVLFGCVSTGPEWQFLRLEGADLATEPLTYPFAEVGLVLAAILAAVAQVRAAAA